MPRLIPAMGLVGAPLLMSSTIGTMFGVNDPLSVWTGIATLPIFLWELSLGLWLAIKGFDRSAPILASGAATLQAAVAGEAGAACALCLRLPDPVCDTNQAAGDSQNDSQSAFRGRF